MTKMFRCALFQPKLEAADVVRKLMANRRLDKAFWSVTVMRLTRLTADQRAVIIDLAERIRKTAGVDMMILGLPPFQVLRNTAEYFIRNKINVKEIDEAFIQRVIESRVVSITEKSINFDYLDEVLKHNADLLRKPATPATPA